MNKKGFTLLEVLLVVALLSVSLGLAALYSQTSQLNADINTQAEILVSNLRLVQSNANAGLTDAPNAIHFTDRSYITFISNSGAPFNPDASSNFEFRLPSAISLQNIILNGGGSNIVFLPPHGETTNYGTLDISSNQMNKSITININSLGRISY